MLQRRGLPGKGPRILLVPNSGLLEENVWWEDGVMNLSKLFVSVFLLLVGFVASSCSSDSSGGGGGSTTLPDTTVSLTIRVADPGNFVDLQFTGGLREFNWGDGSAVVPSVNTSSSFEHLYAAAGTYTITFKDNGCTSLSIFGLGENTEYWFTGVSGLVYLTNLKTLAMNANSLGSFDVSDLPASLTTLELPDNGITAFDATQLPDNITNLDLRLNSALTSSVATAVFSKLLSAGKTNGVLALPSFTFASGSATCTDRANLRSVRGWRTSGISGCI